MPSNTEKTFIDRHASAFMVMTIDDIEIDVIRKKMKTLRIVVFRSTGRVRISAPIRMRYDLIEQFARARLPWIKKHKARFEAAPKYLLEESAESQALDRKYLQWHVPGLIEKWQKVIGVQASGFTIRKMKTRWGSCNIRTKRISLNLVLAKKSTRCLEYIIVHELVHLLERYHNKNFYAYLDRFMPDWREVEVELE